MVRYGWGAIIIVGFIVFILIPVSMTLFIVFQINLLA